MDPADENGRRKTRDIWIRGLFMLLFMVAFGVAQIVLYLVAVVQFLWLLLAGERNQVLTRFGNSLSKWFSETVRFLSCASDDKPFPWKDWPVAHQ